jgi:hypothetical protein
MSRIYVLLGANGDICQMLRLLYHEFQETGVKPRLMVSAEYAPILDGVSYVEPTIYQGPHYEIEKACELAKTMADEVVCAQVKGPKDEVERWVYGGKQHAPATSFVKEQWRVMGKLKLWTEKLPLVFDKRDAAREADVLIKPDTIKTRVIVLALEGKSSPFSQADELRKIIQDNFGQHYHILDLPKAERFYDVIGILENADALFAIDSGPLHLASAVPNLPVFALTQDKPTAWYGSPWAANHVWHCRYGDFDARKWEILEVMASLGKWKREQGLVKVVNGIGTLDHPVDCLTVKEGMTGRDSAQFFGDDRPYPYLRDVVKLALQKCSSKGRIIITRRGVNFSGKVMDSPAYSYRIKEGEFQPIGDAFFATRKWWKEHVDKLPDAVYSLDHYWSEALISYFRGVGAKDVTGRTVNTGEKSPPHSTVRRSVEENRRLAYQAAKTNKIFSRFPKVREQLKSVPMDVSKFHPFAYNPTMIDWNGKIVMVYRWQKKRMEHTRLALAILDNDFKTESVHELTCEGTEHLGLEDAKLFTLNGKLMLSWVTSRYPKDLLAVVRYAECPMP